MEYTLKMKSMCLSILLLGLSTVAAFLFGFSFGKQTQLSAEFIVDHQSNLVGRLGMPLGKVVQLRGVIRRNEPTKELGKNSFTFCVSHIDGKLLQAEVACLEKDMEFANNDDFYTMSLGSSIKCSAYETLKYYGDPISVDDEEIVGGASIGLYLVQHISHVRANHD